MSLVRVGLVLLLLVGRSPGAEVRIVSPGNESILQGNTARVGGTATPDAGPCDAGSTVRLTAGNASFNAPVVAGKWSVDDVPIGAFGPTILTATFQGETHQVLVNRCRPLVARPSQKVRLLWNAAVDEELREVARRTIVPTPTAANLDAFVEAVRSQTGDAFERAFSGVADVVVIENTAGVTTVPAAGADVHTVHFLEFEGDIFGQSPYDCGNAVAQERSEVWVGTYRSAIVDGFSQWAPMTRDDDLTTRIDDLAEALGRTAAHEAGHSFGLVGSSGMCAWMRGCDGGHSCDQFDIDFPLADRFNRGKYIMDPGGKTDNWARLAEPVPTGRSASRTPAVFCRFDRSYFGIVHPLADGGGDQ